MDGVLKFLSAAPMQTPKQPKIPQFVKDEAKLESWFWEFANTDEKFLGAYSLEELKGHTGISKLRLRDVLRRCGWHRMRDRESGVELWSKFGARTRSEVE